MWRDTGCCKEEWKRWTDQSIVEKGTVGGDCSSREMIHRLTALITILLIIKNCLNITAFARFITNYAFHLKLTRLFSRNFMTGMQQLPKIQTYLQGIFVKINLKNLRPISQLCIIKHGQDMED